MIFSYNREPDLLLPSEKDGIQKNKAVKRKMMSDSSDRMSINKEINFVNQRTKRNTWALILTCLASIFCGVYLAESHSTDHLLSVLIKHEARNDSLAGYHADLGRQIVGADRVITEAVTNSNQREIEEFVANRNVKICFGSPYFALGLSDVEKIILEVNKNLAVITENLLTNLADDGFLCSNDIIFGRSDREPPIAVQRIIDKFWSKFSNKTENINIDDLRLSMDNSETSDQEDDSNVSDTVDDSTKVSTKPRTP